jgi:hypothetical protein
MAFEGAISVLGGDPGASMRVSASEQAGRDQTRLRILQAESADPANAGDAALQRELATESAKQGQQPANDTGPFSGAIQVLSGGEGPAPAGASDPRVTAPKAPVELGAATRAANTAIQGALTAGDTVRSVETSFLKGAASLADTAYGIVPGVLGGVTYAAGRLIGKSPEVASESANTLTGALDNPIGKVFGITNDPAYAGEASRRIMNFIGENIGKGAQWVSAHTGLPVKDVENMAQTASAVVPGAIGKVAGAIARPVAAAAKAVGEYKGGIEAKLAAPEPAPLPDRPMAGGGAATVQHNPYPVLSGEVTARDGSFPVIKTSLIPGNVTVPEQAVRAQIANEIVNNGRVREGVATGNEDALRTEHTLAKKADADPAHPDPKAALLRQQIAAEQKGLTDYAEQRVEATGASSRHMNDEQRGMFLNSVVHGEGGVMGWLEGQWNQLYAKARDTMGKNPVSTPLLEEGLADKQRAAMLQALDKPGLLPGVGALVKQAREVGFKTPDGRVAEPGSIAAFEVVRQHLNTLINADSRTAFASKGLKNLLDADVANAGGPGLYEQARGLFHAGNTIFESPGIKNLFGEADANGVIVSKTAPNKILAKLNNMPTDQWQHIYETFDSLNRGVIPGAPEGTTIPQRIRDQAAQAKREMAGSLAREIHDQGAGKIGVWNQNSANNAMNRLESKLAIAMPPDELAKFHTLNLGGQIMPGVHSYEGAGQQINRMNQPGFLERSLPAIGAAAGRFTGIPGGEFVGGRAGENISGRMSASQRLRETNELRKNMEANARLRLLRDVKP